eukprot:g1594.t1
MKFGETLTKNSVDGWRYIAYERLKDLIKENTQRADKQNPHWSRLFKSMLIAEISAVNSFFLGMETTLKDNCKIFSHKNSRSNKRNESLDKKAKGQLSKMMLDLCKYVVINYLAVLKIVKKHDKYAVEKISGEIKSALFTTDFFLSLTNSEVFISMNELMKSIGQVSGPKVQSCPICEESMNIGNATLPCGHSFCWSCLAEATWQKQKQCPVCRKKNATASKDSNDDMKQCTVAAPVELEISTVLGSMSQHYFPFELEKKQEETPVSSPCIESKDAPTSLIEDLKTAELKSSPANPSSVKNLNKEKQGRNVSKRRRPFGSIRCSKCNKFGLDSECCGQKYHVVIRVRRVPTHVRSAILKRAFNSYVEAEKMRQKVEKMYPKEKKSRQHQMKVSRAVKRAFEEGVSGSLFEGDNSQNVRSSAHQQNYNLCDMSHGESSSQARTKKARTNSFAEAFVDANSRSASASTEIDKMIQSLGDEATNDLVTANGNGMLNAEYYERVMLAEARARAAMNQASVNQQHARSLENRLERAERQIQYLQRLVRRGTSMDWADPEHPSLLQMRSPAMSPMKNGMVLSPVKTNQLHPPSSDGLANFELDGISGQAMAMPGSNTNTAFYDLGFF